MPTHKHRHKNHTQTEQHDLLPWFHFTTICVLLTISISTIPHHHRRSRLLISVTISHISVSVIFSVSVLSVSISHISVSVIFSVSVLVSVSISASSTITIHITTICVLRPGEEEEKEKEKQEKGKEGERRGRGKRKEEGEGRGRGRGEEGKEGNFFKSESEGRIIFGLSYLDSNTIQVFILNSLHKPKQPKLHTRQQKQNNLSLPVAAGEPRQTKNSGRLRPLAHIQQHEPSSVKQPDDHINTTIERKERKKTLQTNDECHHQALPSSCKTPNRPEIKP